MMKTVVVINRAGPICFSVLRLRARASPDIARARAPTSFALAAPSNMAVPPNGGSFRKAARPIFPEIHISCRSD
jgi:hypothetical protein